jgi:hypothetical protein
MTGNVVLKVKGKVPGHELRLDAFGKEKVAVKNGKQCNQDERTIVHMSAILQDLQGQQLRRGTHVYPFSFDLPVSLPSSMTSYRPGDRDRHGCKIIYNLGANFGEKVCENFFSVTSAPMPNHGASFLMQPKTHSIKVAGLLNVGTVTFGAYVNKTRVGRGDEVKVSIAAVNNTKAEIRLEIKVVEIIAWTTRLDPLVSRIKNTLVELKNVQHPNLIIGKMTHDSYEMNHATIVSLLESGENSIAVPIPTTARDTYTGERINVSHYIKVKLMTQRFMDNAEAKIPISIGTSPGRVVEVHAQSVTSNPPFHSGELPYATAVAVPEDEIVVGPSAPCEEATVLGDPISENGSYPDNSDFLPSAPYAEELIEARQISTFGRNTASEQGVS